MKGKRLVLLAVPVLLVGAAARWMPGWYWAWRTDNPVRRGAALAAREGCISCHGPTGRDETSNPGSRWGTVPSFYRGNAMMYVRSPEEVERYIATGSPKGEAQKDRGGYHPAPQGASAPPYHMRGFADRLSRRQIRDLAAFVLAADGYLVPQEGPVARGNQISLKFGCESCHGVSGAGGVANPRSFTLRVPGWSGPAFSHLVSGEEEFREWVMDGRSRRWARNPAAGFFLDRANLYMPAFRGSLSTKDAEDLWAYVSWLRSQTAPGAPARTPPGE